jgi:hypothetical protein
MNSEILRARLNEADLEKVQVCEELKKLCGMASDTTCMEAGAHLYRSSDGQRRSMDPQRRNRCGVGHVQCCNNLHRGGASLHRDFLHLR